MELFLYLKQAHGVFLVPDGVFFGPKRDRARKGTIVNLVVLCHVVFFSAPNRAVSVPEGVDFGPKLCFFLPQSAF